jgi:hypothetical protein
MRRNNLVFMWGAIVQYAEREVKHEETVLLLIDLLLQTDKPDISGQHKVLVRGQQALELRCFLQAAQPDLPEVAILGWLRSGRQESIVMAERVTVLTTREIRRVAVEAIKRMQYLE